MTLSFAPHIRDKASSSRIMLDVIIALCPALVASIVIFGPRAALVTLVCVVSCVISEWAYEKALKRTVTVKDFSAVLTGILLAFNLPVWIEMWQAVFGSVVAIILVKQLFGGIGKNFANPAITARVIMFLAFPKVMTTWMQVPDFPITLEAWWQLVKVPSPEHVDAVSGVTPLMFMSRGEYESLPGIWNMIIGTRGGCLGETSSIALLLGGIYLLARRVITWHTPVMFFATVVIMTAFMGGNGFTLWYPMYHLFGGGLFLGAIFMATDYVTTPQTTRGRIIFGIGCGVLTVFIRLYGSYPEGVSFSILIMNTLVPYINKISMSKALGGLKA